MPAEVSAPRKIAAHNVVALHAEPSRAAERVSETLMGRTVILHETQGDWSRIETDDTYTGWAESRWLADPLPGRPLAPIRVVFADVRGGPDGNAPLVIRLPILSAVYVDPTRRVGPGWLACTLPDGREGWLPEPVFGAPDTPDLRLPARRRRATPSTERGERRLRGERIAAQAVAYAREFVGTPYLWGGSSAFGLDCSGFVQLCFRLAGLILGRDARLQRGDPRFVPVERENLAPGDLVFFGRSADRITHVGIHLGDNAFIHAAGGAGVIITPWGDERYSSTFIDARRLDPARAHQAVTRP